MNQVDLTRFINPLESINTYLGLTTRTDVIKFSKPTDSIRADYKILPNGVLFNSKKLQNSTHLECVALLCRGFADYTYQTELYLNFKGKIRASLTYKVFEREEFIKAYTEVFNDKVFSKGLDCERLVENLREV